ncbi:SAM-dependent methyltransferase [Nocardiopsis sp. NPDC007018]|uniref:SAM-dependent methyltransferase n=1 Tax=Nocardiopsis sp. NPDC007018 TaxID=3155721 RepID=UPI0033D87460
MSPVSENPPPVFDPGWLALREEADSGARSPGSLAPLRGLLSSRGAPARPVGIADLGCGAGSQGRWLAPRLPGPQHWTLYDRDPGLLSTAGARLPAVSADGARVSARMCLREVGTLSGDDLAGIDLVTGSALLDLLTREELDAVVGAVAAAGCPALFTLSVTGRVEFFPGEREDAALTEAFNAHQRRGGRLGPDAVGAAAASFAERGYRVLTQPSPWRLGPEHAPLVRAWLRGWVGAALEQDPDAAAGGYLERRLGECDRGELGVLVHHDDLLVVPGGGTGSP